MILSDKQISELKPFEPFNQEQVSVNSYDVKCGPIITELICLSRNPLKALLQRLRLIQQEPVVIKGNNKIIEIKKSCEKGFVLRPNRVYVVATDEMILPVKNVTWKLYTKSSMGRHGLSTCKCAGSGDVGFSGHITMELAVETPIRIFAGQKIAQVVFFETTEVEKDYLARGGQYNNTSKLGISSSHKNI